MCIVRPRESRALAAALTRPLLYFDVRIKLHPTRCSERRNIRSPIDSKKRDKRKCKGTLVTNTSIFAIIMAPESDPPDVLSELRARLAVTSGLDEGEYIVEAVGSNVAARTQTTNGSSQPSAISKPAATTEPVFILRTGLKLRMGPELSSELAEHGDGGIRAGARVHVLESQTLSDGTERRCLAFEGHKEPLGWVSAFVNGEPNLLTDAQAQAAHAATLAAAVTGRGGTPPHKVQTVQPSPSPQKSQKKLPSFGGGGEKCQACGKTAYQAERTSVGSYFFHVDCMRCAKCGPSRRLGSEYGLAANAEGVICLYCPTHEAEARSLHPQPTDSKGDETAIKAMGAAAAAAAAIASAHLVSPEDSTRPEGFAAKGAGLGTAEDRALEEALKSPGRAVPLEVAAGVDDGTNPFARCLQCLG